MLINKKAWEHGELDVTLQWPGQMNWEVSMCAKRSALEGHIDAVLGNIVDELSLDCVVETWRHAVTRVSSLYAA